MQNSVVADVQVLMYKHFLLFSCKLFIEHQSARTLRLIAKVDCKLQCSNDRRKKCAQKMIIIWWGSFVVIKINAGLKKTLTSTAPMPRKTIFLVFPRAPCHRKWCRSIHKTRRLHFPSPATKPMRKIVARQSKEPKATRWRKTYIYVEWKQSVMKI